MSKILQSDAREKAHREEVKDILSRLSAMSFDMHEITHDYSPEQNDGPYVSEITTYEISGSADSRVVRDDDEISTVQRWVNVIIKVTELHHEITEARARILENEEAER